LKKYLASFNPEFIGVTGSLDEIKKITSKLSVYFQKVGDNDGENYLYEMNHTAGIFLTNPDGKLVASFKPTANPEELSLDIKRVLL
jgi:protein SCO1/2